MSISIPSTLSTASPAAVNSSSTSPAPQQVQQPTKTSEDTVTLTEAQRVYLLHIQGQTVPQIATSLRLTVNIVNNYLGISSTS